MPSIFLPGTGVFTRRPAARRATLRSLAWLTVTALVLLLAGCARTPEQKKARFIDSGKKYMEKKDYARASIQFQNAVKVMPKDAEAHYQLALAYLDTRDLRRGFAELRRATELNPKHAAAQLKISQLMTLSKDPKVLEDAQQRASGVLTANPGSADALYTLALTEARLGKQDDAAQHLQEALSKVPDDSKSSFALAAIELRQGKQAEAEQTIKSAGQKNPKSADVAVAMGRFYAAMKKFPDAEAQFRRGLSLEPKNSVALLALGETQLIEGQKDKAAQSFQQLSHFPDKRYQSVYARFLLQDRQLGPAITELERLYKEDPKDREARTRLVAAYLSAGREEDASKLLSDVLKKNSKDADAAMQRAEIYLGTGKINEAESDLNDALRYKPDSGMAHLLMSRVYRARGQTSNQRRELNEALRVQPELLAARLELSQVFLSNSDPRSVLDLLAKAPPDQKNSLPVQLQRNWALIQMKNLPEAQAGVAKVLGVSKSSDVLIQDASVKMLQGNFAAARTSFEEALKANPQDLRALAGLVQTYGAQGQIAAAIPKVREYAAAHPDSAQIQLFWGRLLAGNGKSVEAEAALTKAQSLDKSGNADYSLAQFYESQRQYDRARGLLTPLLEKKKDSIPLLLELGQVENETGHYPAAIDYYKKALNIDSRNLTALNNLAFLMSERTNDLDGALRYADQAIKIAPEAAAIQDTVGWVYYRKGLYRNALPLLEGAVKKQDTALHRYHLAMAYFKSGDTKQGDETLSAALKMNPNLPEAADALKLKDLSK